MQEAETIFSLIHSLALGGNEEVEGPGPPSSLSTQRLEPWPLHRPISVCAGPSLMEGTGVQALLARHTGPPRPLSDPLEPRARKPCQDCPTWSPCPFVFTHRYPKASHGPQLRSPRVFVWVGEVHVWAHKV